LRPKGMMTKQTVFDMETRETKAAIGGGARKS
jgi:hypothetical protein